MEVPPPPPTSPMIYPVELALTSKPCPGLPEDAFGTSGLIAAHFACPLTICIEYSSVPSVAKGKSFLGISIIHLPSSTINVYPSGNPLGSGKSDISPVTTPPL